MLSCVTDVTLRRVDADLFGAVVALRVTQQQAGWVASNVKSLGQAGADEALTAYAVFDGAERSMARPASLPVGFALV